MTLVHLELPDLAAGPKYLLGVVLVHRLEVAVQPPLVLEDREPLALIMLPEKQRDKGTQTSSKDDPPQKNIGASLKPVAVHCVWDVDAEVVAVVILILNAPDIQLKINDAQNETQRSQNRSQSVEKEPVAEHALILLLVLH